MFFPSNDFAMSLKGTFGWLIKRIFTDILIGAQKGWCSTCLFISPAGLIYEKKEPRGNPVLGTVLTKIKFILG
jgi:hypothetical protein